MIEKTEGLVLRVFPFSETSQVVIWLTGDHGRIATAVKGARRAKSLFAGQYDLFYTCELLFYRRERDGLHIVRECAPLQARSRFRTDWRAFACASYICGLIAGITFPGGREHALYAHATAALDSLADAGAAPALLLWFELRLAGILGFAPRLGRCAACNGALERQTPAVFSAERGGMLCPGCAPRRPGPGIRFPPDALAILRRWQEAESPAVPRRTRCTRNQLLVLQQNLGTFLQYHLDYIPPGRRIALEMISPQTDSASGPGKREGQ
jgi:DNA repair protein RecO (recombination protein O)